MHLKNFSYSKLCQIAFESLHDLAFKYLIQPSLTKCPLLQKKILRVFVAVVCQNAFELLKIQIFHAVMSAKIRFTKPGV